LTTDARVFLTCSGWIKNLQTSILVFDIIQFFLLLNHQLIPLILDKVEFHPKVSLFFSNYLMGRKIHYLWNNFISSSFNVDVGVDQGSALSSILFTLFISPIFHIFEKRVKNLEILISFLLFVDDDLFIFQEKSLDKTNTNLFVATTLSSSY